MTEFRADLHCHTTCSDGSLSPEALLQLAKDLQLSGISITDHDSIEAYAIAIPLAAKLGIEIIPGVEFSAIQNGITVHVLAYSFDLQSPAIVAFCQKHQQRRYRRNFAILELLKKYDMPVSEEEISTPHPDHPQRTIGRPHIALAMIQKGYVKTVYEAFQKYLGEGKKCYAQGESFTVQETIDVIHEGHGFAVIAHPHLIHNPPIVHQLLALNFDGIESYYANFTNDKNRRWLRIAEKKGWVATGGSDFHGSIKPQIALGASWVPEETFRLLQKKNKN